MKTQLICLGIGLALAWPTTSGALDAVTQRQIERRATEAVIWSLPAVNSDLMLQAFVKAGGAANQIAIWSHLPSWKNQTLTPNPDTVYLMPFFDTKLAGPMVLEIPPADGGSITGNIDTIWQVALEDAGPAGADKGKGGKYLILPPGYTGKIPKGYISLKSDTYTGYALIRSTVTIATDKGVAEAVEYGKRVKFYPLATAGQTNNTVFVDVVDKMFDATIPYDASYFEALNRVVQQEPWLPRDRAMIDPLKSLGIEKGKPFGPDEDKKEALAAGAREAKEWLEHKRRTAFPAYFGKGSWFVPALAEGVQAQADNFAKADAYPTDARALTYSMGYVGIKRLGQGQFYLMALMDDTGQPLDGAKTYRLRVPPKAPAKQYWSATAYDSDTHGFIRGVDRFSLSSNSPDIRTDDDGSIDVYFGPSAPNGLEHNWVPTKPNGRFEVLFRLYGPGKSILEKSWVLPDLVTVN